MRFFRYPKTLHLEGSGISDKSQRPFSEVAGRHLVVEEKMDGANCAIGFENGSMTLQSRGHYLTGGGRERHFDLLKQWAAAQRDTLFECLGNKFLMFGEWLYAKHTVFYDMLPHYFMEFDILDKVGGHFLSTTARRSILAGSPVISVAVLASGFFEDQDALFALSRRSLFKSGIWRERLAEQVTKLGLKEYPEQTDPSDMSEGLYIKIEEAGAVCGRYKMVRPNFLKTALDSGSHWLARPIIPNMLAPDADIWRRYEGIAHSADSNRAFDCGLFGELERRQEKW